MYLPVLNRKLASKISQVTRFKTDETRCNCREPPVEFVPQCCSMIEKQIHMALTVSQKGLCYQWAHLIVLFVSFYYEQILHT